MKSKIEINISVIDDGPVVMRCQGQNTSKGKALDMVRGKGKRYMVSSEKEMSFMTELMRRQGEVQP